MNFLVLVIFIFANIHVANSQEIKISMMCVEYPQLLQTNYCNGDLKILEKYINIFIKKT
jgi:hypothetical protein